MQCGHVGIIRGILVNNTNLKNLVSEPRTSARQSFRSFNRTVTHITSYLFKSHQEYNRGTFGAIPEVEIFQQYFKLCLPDFRLGRGSNACCFLRYFSK